VLESPLACVISIEDEKQRAYMSGGHLWRRVLIGGDTTLVELHEIIHQAMGWEGYHLWTFSINGREYGHVYGLGAR
jgi:Plasmid pRiA4b ORF-3-like protein